jgi:hypothetical protein
MEIAARARALVGVRFRPQGRIAREGVECIGLAALALRVEGARRDYAVRGGNIKSLERSMEDAGLQRAVSSFDALPVPRPRAPLQRRCRFKLGPAKPDRLGLGERERHPTR